MPRSDSAAPSRSRHADVLVLMYHAVPGGSRLAHAADPHYSVDRARFVQQLQLVCELGLRPRSVRDLLADPAARQAGRPLALTFDDGHESNFAAYAEIARQGGSADLFINPGTVGTRGFLSWAQLRELAAQGASIQSHGQRHVFLDELSPDEVCEELSLSRRRIADEVEQAVTLFAPPNGRMPPGLPQLAREMGYQAVCSSRVGLWREGQDGEIPRLAMLATTSQAQLRGWLLRAPWVMTHTHARAWLLGGAKKVLGRRLYVALRDRALSQEAPP
jgi:peptidoglycan/xylan/chitin deacetylase (PgdA/CDA1 family)